MLYTLRWRNVIITTRIYTDHIQMILATLYADHIKLDVVIQIKPTRWKYIFCKFDINTSQYSSFFFFFFENVKRWRVSYVFWNKISYFWSSVCNSFGSKLNSFVIVGMQRLKISEIVRSFAEWEKTARHWRG